MRNVLTFDVEDWPQSTLDQDLPITRRVRDNTLRILEILGRARTSATFFVLGIVAERFPELAIEIQSAGHEVACHGHAHQAVSTMTPEAFRTDVRRSIAVIEGAIGTRVLGYRAPDFSVPARSLWALTILAEEGLRYDSSVFPFAGPRYGIPQSFRVPYRVLGPPGTDLVEFPLTTLEVLGRRLPAAGGGYFRIFPYAYSRWAVERLNRCGAPATAYFHPYEIDAEEIALSGRAIPLMTRLSQGLGRKGVAAKLVRLLADFEWGTAASWLTDPGARSEWPILDLSGAPDAGPRWVGR